jgi:sporulation protein YabP
MQNGEKKQNIIITDRQRAEISGVKFITLLDEERILLDTEMGDLMIEGKELKLENLEKNNGAVTLFGKIDGVFYIEKRRKNKGRR